MGLTPQTAYWMLAVAGALANLGIAIAIPAMTTAVMQVAGKANANSAAAALNANRQIGALVGVAMVGVFVHMFGSWSARVYLSYGCIAGAYLLALLLALRYIKAGSATTAGAAAQLAAAGK